MTPPTAPQLTNQPVDHTGDSGRKTIPVSFLRQKFAEFITNRTGSITSHNPPLRIIRIDASPHNTDSPLPETYADVQSITAGNDGQIHYVSSPMSLGQLYQTCGDTYVLNAINSASISITADANQAAPITLTLDFAPGGSLAISGAGRLGGGEVHKLSISLKLTLDKATGPTGEGTVVDAMSWVQTIKNATYDSTRTSLLNQFINVNLDLGGTGSPGSIVHDAIRDHIYDKLTETNPFTGRTLRDDINSMATSWLLGGVADDELNTDENNAVIDYIKLDLAQTPGGEDLLHISYTGPRNVFVPQRPAAWPPADFAPGTLANIDHIVVLMMENRSFDHMLGYLSLPTSSNGMGRQDVDGLKGGEFNPYEGKQFPSFELGQTLFAPDPPHSHEPVHHAINGGKMDGFVQSYAEEHGDALAGQIMGYHTGAHVPAYDALARDFAVGHRWFASHPGPTFCNRFYALTGRLNLDPRGFWEFSNSSPQLPVYTPTIFDYLTGAADPQTGQPITWKYFEHGYCFLRFFEKYTFDGENIVAADDPQRGFFASARTGQLPSVSFLDPHFIEYPPDADCDGPPADVSQGQAFVRQVVEAVVASPLWNKTLLLIVYDEHGGFFDHVPPSPAAPVSDDLPITTHGVRVPAFVISPWVGAGTVFGHDGALVVPGLHFDHTSILKTIARRFLWKNPPYMGARYAAANDLSSVIGSQLRQPQFLPFIPYRLLYTPSNMVLEVRQVGGPGPGSILWQDSPGDDSVIAQHFAFEDAGDGLVYIRSHVSNLYVTAEPPDQITSNARIGGGSAGSAGGGVGSVGVTGSPGLIQDVRYAPGHVGPRGLPQGPEFQKWRLAPLASVSPSDRDLYVVSSQAYPDLVLQPADPAHSQSRVILGPADGTSGTPPRKTWKVTSPRLDGGTVITI